MIKLKFNSSCISKAFLTGVLILISTPVTLAQSVNSVEVDTFQSNEYDSLGGSSFGNSFNPMDIIHRSNLSTSRSMDEFQQDSQKGIQDAASEFKRLQQQRLNAQPETSVDQMTNEEQMN